MGSNGKTTTRDMTTGPIVSQMILYAVPLLLGNVFQILYNTVDTIVVGHFVGTSALAAVGSTTMIVNIMVLFFNGLSVGAGVVISRNFGAKKFDELHKSIETTMAMTFILSVLFTIAGVLMVRPMLIFMSTPEDVIGEATTYLQTYFAGIAGLLVYNMGSGILRAVGDSKRPLMFLIFTSILNIILDLFFVIALNLGIFGVAFATILSQLFSAVLVMGLITRTSDIYRLTWKDLRIEPGILRDILNIGMPTAFQAMFTSISNVFVQSYVNFFGSACMAGWSCYNKLAQFVFIPMNSMSGAAATFVGQNVGAKNEKRARTGTLVSVLLALSVTAVVVCFVVIFARQSTGIFTNDQAVIDFGAKFLRMNSIFLLANCTNHVLAGAIRGRGDSKGPMVIMLTCFIVIRQLYLFLATHYIANTPAMVGISYPVGWSMCCITEVLYYRIRYGNKKKGETEE